MQDWLLSLKLSMSVPSEEQLGELAEVLEKQGLQIKQSFPQRIDGVLQCSYEAEIVVSLSDDEVKHMLYDGFADWSKSLSDRFDEPSVFFPRQLGVLRDEVQKVAGYNVSISIVSRRKV